MIRSVRGKVLGCSSSSAEERYFMVEVGIFHKVSLKTLDTQRRNGRTFMEC